MTRARRDFARLRQLVHRRCVAAFLYGQHFSAAVSPSHIRGPEAGDHTLYASHTVWKNRAVFEAWTKSEAFRAAHSRAGGNKPLYLDHPPV
jgi:hypothetical protein